MTVSANCTEKSLVTIVIPNWNGKDFLCRCLDSLLSQTHEELEIILVDNGSTDGSLDLVKSSYGKVRLIVLPHNTGFAFAVNMGIKGARGEFIGLLNNDTEVDRNWVAELVKALNDTPTVGSVACKMLAYDDPTILDGAGDGYRRGGLPGRIGHGETDIGQFDEPRLVLGACGGAVLYRRQTLAEVGLFDEDYFAYLEDVDHALRCQSLGYSCLYVPTAVVYHLGCGTTGGGYSPLVVRLSARNNINTIVKNLPLSLIIKFIPQIIYWQSFYLAVVILRGGQFVSWLKGIWEALIMLPKMLKKRDFIEKSRRISADRLEALILRSEEELKQSKRRLHQQILSKRVAPSTAFPEATAASDVGEVFEVSMDRR